MPSSPLSRPCVDYRLLLSLPNDGGRVQYQACRSVSEYAALMHEQRPPHLNLMPHALISSQNPCLPSKEDLFLWKVT